MVTLLEVCCVVLACRFPPEFLSRPPSGATLPPGEGIKGRSGHPGRGVPTGIFFVAVETWCRAHRRAVGLPPPLGLIVLRTLYHPTFYTGITA